MPFRKPILRRFGCPKEVQVGSGVSEAQEAFVTTFAMPFSPQSLRHPVKPTQQQTSR